MTKIIRLFIVVAIIAFLIRSGLPWLEKVMDTGFEIGTSSNSSCVSIADRTRDEVGNTIPRFATMPIDLSSWADSRDSLQRSIDDAMIECECSLDSCATATRALEQLTDMLYEVDSGFESGQPPLNLARTLENVDNTIARARGQVRQGS